MIRTTPSSIVRAASIAALTATALAGRASSQWSSVTYNPSKSVPYGNWFLEHETAAGHQAFSAIAQTWTTVSPSGASIIGYGDDHIVFNEGGGTLRAWSAYSNATATQTFLGSINTLMSPGSGASYTAYDDLAPFTNGVLRAYSAYTNSWASLALSTLPSWSLVWGQSVAVQRDGLKYHAYSAYTGQWVTLDVAVEGGNPQIGADYAVVDLRGTSGPFQYAAFSARRGKWVLSPVYPSTGAGIVQTSAANVCAIKTDTGVPGTFRYAAFSPFTAQWTTSSLAHSTSATQTATAFKNILRIQDSDPSARFEIFGAGNGIWQSLTGSNLTEDSLHEDFHVVRDSAGFTSTLYFASAMVGGGYIAHPMPTFFPSVGQGSHGCLISGSNDLSMNQAWAYSALTHALAGPIAQPLGSGVSSANAGSVFGFNLQGSASFGQTAWAYSARSGQWSAGPSLSPSESWTTSAPFGAGELLVAWRNNFGSYDLNVYDEHRGTWLAPLNTSASFSVGQHAVLIADPTSGVYRGYSAARGAWSSQSGVGQIMNPGGFSVLTDNLVWFYDANNKLWVFPLPDRTQSWFAYPSLAKHATSGATSGGATPYLGVSVRGTPAAELALVFAALALGPAPLSLPGFGGALDLDLGGAFQLASLGVFDADGVRETKLPIANPIAGGTQAWMQAIVVDLATLQASFAGRATGVRFY